MNMEDKIESQELQESETTIGSESDYCPESDLLSTQSDFSQSQKSDCTDSNMKYIVFESCLDKLIRFCPDCGAPVTETSKLVVGTQINIKISCHNGHTSIWHSQPMVHKMPAGNLLISAAILFSGNTFTHIENLCKLFQLQFISHTTYNDIQQEILFPTINAAYLENQQNVHSYLSGKPLMVSGDGRCDSPGYSAKYQTYTIMDQETNLILDFTQVQVTQAGNSNAMEKLACQQTLDKLLASYLQINTFATDRHIQIRSMMKTNYSSINHQFDIFHVCKNLKKKLIKISNQSGCGDIASWIKSICNHLWWSCASSEGDVKMVREKWLSLIHHISNCHIFLCNDIYTQCAHDELSPEVERSRKWLMAGSSAHTALMKVVTHKTLVADLQQMTSFCHTGDLEVYHSLLLKYCPKRLNFSFPGMLARTQLAILDHNNNCERSQATTADGQLRFNIKFTKQSKSWIAKPIAQHKNNNWAIDLMNSVILVKTKVMLATNPDIPELPKNIATLPQPPKDELITQMTSRFR